jgi:ubiquinone/menaquinone biosynthesis C-methylase UbiE
MNYTYPESFARFYDTIYHSIRDGVDNDYFQKEMKKAGGKVLEVGVGTGRLFMDALNSGIDIYGIDISSEMLKVLNEKLPSDKQHRVSLQSISDFKLGVKFDLIVAPFRVIMHLLEKEEQIKALNNVFKHLNDGGLFIFDAFIPDLNQLIKGLDNHIDFEGEYLPGMKLKRIVSTRPDLIRQLINIRFRMEWEEGEKTYQDEWDLPLRFFFRYELEHLIERSEFRDYKFYGDYQGNELNSNSREFIVHCRK